MVEVGVILPEVAAFVGLHVLVNQIIQQAWTLVLLTLSQHVLILFAHARVLLGHVPSLSVGRLNHVSTNLTHYGQVPRVDSLNTSAPSFCGLGLLNFLVRLLLLGDFCLRRFGRFGGFPRLFDGLGLFGRLIHILFGFLSL